jgi:hypothetical protein
MSHPDLHALSSSKILEGCCVLLVVGGGGDAQ